jgi:hypothetical protein
MKKDDTLIIQDWDKGQAESNLVGFQTMKCVEVFDTAGVVKIANRSLAKLSTPPTALPVFYVEDTLGNYYYGLSSGKVYKNDGTLIQDVAETVWDAVVYKDYLLVTHGTFVSAYGPLSGAPAWNDEWKSGLTSGTYSKILVGQDDIIYIANGNSVATITSFTAGSPPTATLTLVALDLPEGVYIVTFAELGKFLMIGTCGASTWATRNNYKKASIYLWDRVSTSFNLPIQINENSIQQMFSDNNKLYVVAGIKGNLYVTDSTNYYLLKKLSWNADRPPSAFCQFYPNAIGMNNNGNLLIGSSTYADPYAGGDTASKHGIYEVELKSGQYNSVLKTIPNNGDTGASSALYIGCINSGANDTTVFGWQSGSTYGLDTTDTTVYTSYTAVIESSLYQVGTRLNRHSPYQNLEFTLQKPLITGQAIRISYRVNGASSYTTIGTFDYATLGGVISHNTKALIDDAETLQIKIELTQPTSATVGQNINLMNIKIW